MTTSLPERICSARGCRNDAVWALSWNNPAIHAPEYRKIWLACADHLQSLGDFLDLRGFSFDALPVAELDRLERQ